MNTIELHCMIYTYIIIHIINIFYHSKQNRMCTELRTFALYVKHTVLHILFTEQESELICQLVEINVNVSGKYTRYFTY